MPELARVTARLRIVGEALDPDEITRLVDIEPTGWARKGDVHRTASGGEVVARSGSWRLDAGVPGDLNSQISALLNKLPSDPTIWRELTKRYACDVFCGLFIRDGSEGTELSPQVMSMLGVRGLRLDLDVPRRSAEGREPIAQCSNRRTLTTSWQIANKDQTGLSSPLLAECQQAGMPGW